jgi:hypothetical protein
LTDNILISLSFVFLDRNTNSNEINDLTFKSDRLLGRPGGVQEARQGGRARHAGKAMLIRPGRKLWIAPDIERSSPSRRAQQAAGLMAMRIMAASGAPMATTLAAAVPVSPSRQA